jgi:hypothetical protein
MSNERTPAPKPRPDNLAHGIPKKPPPPSQAPLSTTEKVVKSRAVPVVVTIGASPALE